MTREESKSVLEAKMDHILSSATVNAQGIIEKIESTGKLMNDFVAPLGANGAVKFDGNGNVYMDVNNDRFTLHPNAIVQAGEKLGVPSGYIRTLAESTDDWKHILCAEILNKHSEHTDRQRVLVRAVGDQVRGILSDQYRRLDTPMLVNAFVESALSKGARFLGAHADDLQAFMEVVLPDLIEVPTEHNGTEFIAYGIRFASGDFGTRSVEMRAFLFKPVCTNGMVREQIMRQIHLGGRIPDNVRLSDRTFRLDTETQASTIRDVVGNLLEKENILSEMKLIQDASATTIKIESEIKALPKAGLLKSETEQVQKMLLENNVEDGVQGKSTLWKLINGVTAVARTASPTRRREMEEIAGGLMNRVKK